MDTSIFKNGSTDPVPLPVTLCFFLLGTQLFNGITHFHYPSDSSHIFLSPLTPSFGPHYFTKVALIETVDGANVEGECSVIISLKLSEVFQNFEPAPLVYLASRTPASSFSSHITMLSLFCLLLPVFLLFSEALST